MSKPPGGLDFSMEAVVDDAMGVDVKDKYVKVRHKYMIWGSTVCTKTLCKPSILVRTKMSIQELYHIFEPEYKSKPNFLIKLNHSDLKKCLFLDYDDLKEIEISFGTTINIVWKRVLMKADWKKFASEQMNNE